MTQFNLPKMEVLQFQENEIFQSPENSKFKSSETAIVRITYFSGNIISRKQNISISRKLDVSLTNVANSRKKYIFQQMARHNPVNHSRLNLPQNFRTQKSFLGVF